jgi:uncharacterized protein YjiS (DUF1127 family)
MQQTAVTRTRVDHGRDLWQDLAHRWRAARERQRQRRALAALDDRLLLDIGVTRAQALAEAARPPWR